MRSGAPDEHHLVIFVLERERERAAPAAASAASVVPAGADRADLEDPRMRPTRAAAKPGAHGRLAEPELEYDVTLVSQTSEDRVWMVDHLATR